MLDVFKPAPAIPEIQDPEEVSKLYKYWRIRIWYSMFIGYALFYFTRKSFTFAMPGMIESLGFEKTQLGMLGSIFALSYGFSKFGSGILSDRSNPRYFMAFGLILTGFVNILFGLSSSLFLFALFWGMNGWFQGFGWPPCARQLTQWYSQSERGSWWSSFNVSHNVGAFIIPWIVGLSIYYFDWRFALYIPGIICILGGFFLINRLRDTPQSLGLPPIEKYRNDFGGARPEKTETLTNNQILVEYVLKNKFIWMLALSSFFVYIVRTGVNDWTALYLRETKDYSLLGANGCVSIFEIGGFCGNLAAGWSSDYLFKARRGPVNVIFAIGMVFAMLAFWYVPPGYPILDSCAMFFLGFCIFGPQMMMGIAAAELSHKNAAASSTGFIGNFGYFGAASAGYPLSAITQAMGWDGYFMTLTICCLLSVVCLAPLWGATKNSRELAAKPA